MYIIISATKISQEECDAMKGEGVHFWTSICLKKKHTAVLALFFFIFFSGPKWQWLRDSFSELMSLWSFLPSALSLKELNWKSKEVCDSGELGGVGESLFQQVPWAAATPSKAAKGCSLCPDSCGLELSRPRNGCIHRPKSVKRQLNRLMYFPWKPPWRSVFQS